jgi:hypothetical protein
MFSDCSKWDILLQRPLVEGLFLKDLSQRLGTGVKSKDAEFISEAWSEQEQIFPAKAI